MSVPSADRLAGLLRPIVEEHGLDLDDVALSPAGRRRILRVVVDKDGGVTLDDVADVSRSVSQALDESDLLGGTAYTLEVSSPGVDRPLTDAKHWRRAAGRLVTVRLLDGRQTTGRVVSADDGSVTLETANGTTSLALTEVRDGLIQVEFSRPQGGDDGSGEEVETWTST